MAELKGKSTFEKSRDTYVSSSKLTLFITVNLLAGGIILILYLLSII